MLYLRTDHLYFKKFGSVEAVVAQDELALRSKRTLDYSKTSCMLYLRTDHLYFKKFGSVEAVVAQIGNYMRAVNDIYDKADFEGIRLINFKVKTLHHDEKGECEASTPTGGQGNFLMFPYASEGNQGNNDRFSPCSVKHISKLLRIKKDKCFTESGLPICGNQIVEDGEECDVGHNDTDPCCYSASQSEDFHCKLKPQKQCSPSQGKCCSHQCVFKPQGQKCQQENDCEFESECSGVGASCPSPTPKANMTTCHLGTRVCINGVISDDDPSSLQYSPFIGPEKLLMLHSRENWDNYCLSYLMTDRDYNGVLGLAWEGKPGNA
ncbi:Disintegrin and metalloproteinase domain-containing protein 10 [Acipenser ruthenus]|uniref:Disintegrin and metalloproteinase domain-containing protein 10 n=1 Tax=Acipenser ruthenus TaxID=7906 RepID=A0A444UVI2_ACIRT|nr:Disintegrin and metalloproteinase domain-containing protein 10 [Acipenser ruthenus]